MSIVNNANPGSQINLICLISKFLYDNPYKYTYQELLEELRPETLLWLDMHKTRFTSNFKFWEKHEPKLWLTDENGKYYLNLSNVEKFELTDISNLVKKKLFCQIDNNFLEPKNKEFAPVYRIISLLNLVDNFSPISGIQLSSSTLDDFLKGIFSPYQLNSSERSYFLEWGHFLGFLEPQAKDNYVVDPYQAVLPLLKSIFQQNNVLSIKQFLKALGDKTPTLGLGYYSQNVLLKVKEHLGEDILVTKIPGPLSQALERLNHNGILKITQLADDKNGMFLTLPNNQRFISAVEFNEGAI